MKRKKQHESQPLPDDVREKFYEIVLSEGRENVQVELRMPVEVLAECISGGFVSAETVEQVEAYVDTFEDDEPHDDEDDDEDDDDEGEEDEDDDAAEDAAE